jgi:hypothetical protein
MTTALVRAIEKNMKAKVVEIAALYIYDRSRKLWFAGTDKCTIKFPIGLRKQRTASLSSLHLLKS